VGPRAQGRVGVILAPQQVIECRLAVRQVDNVIGHRMFSQVPDYELSVIEVIFDQQN
jgi:hypothetical protein